MRRLIPFIVLLLSAFLSSTVYSQQKIDRAPSRSWTGPVFGGATIEATPTSFDGKNLTLKTRGGELIVPLDKLADEDRDYVRSLLKSSAKPGGKTATFPRGTVNVKKYLPHLPRGAIEKKLRPHADGTSWNSWYYCISPVPDGKTFVMSRFTDEAWMLSYDIETETFGKVFESPGKGNREILYHVVSPKDPDKCYAAFASSEICEYSVATGRILRRINTKGKPYRLLPNRSGDKLYVSGTPQVWDLKTNRVSVLGDYETDCFALDSKENRLAIGVRDKGAVMIYNASGRKSPQVVPVTGKNVGSMRFVNDGKFLLVGTADPATISLISLSTNKPVFTVLGFESDRIADLFFNSDGSLLFAVPTKGSETVPMFAFDTKTMLPVCMFDGNHHMENAALTPDEKHLILPTVKAFSIAEVPNRETIDATVEKLKGVP